MGGTLGFCSLSFPIIICFSIFFLLVTIVVMTIMIMPVLVASHKNLRVSLLFFLSVALKKLKLAR